MGRLRKIREGSEDTSEGRKLIGLPPRREREEMMQLRVEKRPSGPPEKGSKEEVLSLVREMMLAEFPCPHCGKPVRQASPERQRAIQQYVELRGFQGKQELLGDLQRMPHAELVKLVREVFSGLQAYGVELEEEAPAA